MGMEKKALFLDRDGILIEDTAYPYKEEDLHIRRSIIPLLKKATARGFLLIVVTNQSGIARGIFSEDQFHRFQNQMLEAFKSEGISFQGSYYCPYLKKAEVEIYRRDSDDRKPKPGMFLKAQKDFNLDFSQSLMIGDKESDRIEIPELRCLLLQGNYPLRSTMDVFNSEEEIMKELEWI